MEEEMRNRWKDRGRKEQKNERNNEERLKEGKLGRHEEKGNGNEKGRIEGEME